MQRTFLGLSHNPFVPPQEGFYPGADRKAHLDQLRHLSQWSNRVIVVTGPYGVGKSTLYRELSNSLDPKTKGARISGSVVTSEREVLVGLLQGLGIAFDRKTHIDELVQFVIAHIEEQSQAKRVCMALLDDAHQLEPAAVNRILQIVAQSTLRVVFFTETSLIQTISSAARRLDLEWFEIRLSGFPKTDIRGYMEWRFEQAQYRGGLPYTASQFDKIVARSKGNPHVINQVASQLLSDLEAGEVERPGGFPLVHAVLAVLLILIVGLVYMLVQPPEEVLQPPLVASVEESIEESVERTGSSANSLEASSQDGEDEAAVKSGTGYLPELKPLDTTRSAEAPRQSPVIAQLDSPPVAEPTREEEESAQAEVVQDKPVPQPAPEPAPEPAPAPARIPEPEPEPETAPVQEPGTSPVPIVERASGVYGSEWLLRQDPSRYTLQLVTVSTVERAEALVQRQADPSEFAIYRTKRGDRSLFVVTYGLFSNRAAAVRAAESLTGELGQLNPWIRPLGLVQDAIRQAP